MLDAPSDEVPTWRSPVTFAAARHAKLHLHTRVVNYTSQPCQSNPFLFAACAHDLHRRSNTSPARTQGPTEHPNAALLDASTDVTDHWEGEECHSTLALGRRQTHGS